MNKKINPLGFKLTKFLFGSLLIGIPLLATVEAKADMHKDMPRSEMDMKETMTPTETGVYNDTDGGYDGEPVATVIPTEGTINVMLKNDTNALIDYQAIGYTENQTLEGGEKHTMINLPLPVVIRSARQDGGFIKVMPIDSMEEEGNLEIMLNEDPDFYDDSNRGVIRIEEDGSVYLN